MTAYRRLLWLPQVLEQHITQEPTGCWLWDRLGSDGYGRCSIKGRSQMAHRASYEILIGPIPDGLQLDHLCRHRGCVNPDHLEPVTGRENLRRSPLTVNSINRAKSRCPQGHPYEGDNLLVRHNRKGDFRICMTCKRAQDRENQRRYRAARRAAA